jgi:hypothetical protein
MQASKLLQKIISKSCNIHQKRLEALMAMTKSLVENHDLSIVGLGRGIANHAKDKSNINRADRLIGNETLYHEALDIQSALAGLVLGNKMKPLILVDWSSATVAERYQLLRAALPLGGRAVTIYEEVHPLNKYNNQKIHKEFLENLQKALPKGCQPIIVTDAGFGIPWFKEVSRMGWDFVGRIINNSYYQLADEEDWKPLTGLLSYKKEKVKRLGKVKLSKGAEFECYLQVYKGKHKGRVRKNAYGDKASRSVSKRCAKSARKAWVLAHSLGDKQIVSERVIKIYASRMQIEESFRDIKNPRYGFGLRHSRTLGVMRLTNLFLVGLIGTLLAWITGLCAQAYNLHRTFQTNSIKNRAVLSVFFIGCHVAKRGIRFVKKELLEAITAIQELAYVF